VHVEILGEEETLPTEAEESHSRLIFSTLP